MRKIIASFLAIVFVCSLSISMVGCGGNKAATSSKSTSTPTGSTTHSTTAEPKKTGS